MIVNFGEKGRRKLDRMGGGCSCRYFLRRFTETRAPSLTVGFLPLLRAAVEDGVDNVEGNHAASDHCTSSDSAPKNIAPGELPNREQASNYGHQNASARRPERNRPDHIGIQETPSYLAPFDFVHIISL